MNTVAALCMQRYQGGLQLAGDGYGVGRKQARLYSGPKVATGGHHVHYETSSNLAGDVSWVQFDLPWGDVAACLVQTPTLPPYTEFAADVAAKKFLETSYETDAPQWWHPKELIDGVYTLRRNNTKILADICVGVGRLPEEAARVYIGAFDAR